MAQELRVLGGEKKGRKYNPSLAAALNNSPIDSATEKSSGAAAVTSSNDALGSTIPFEKAFFPSGQFGKDLLRKYNAKVKAEYDNADVLTVLKWSNDTNCVTGSTPPAVVLINQMLRPLHIRSATQSELEKIAVGNLLPLQGQSYEDSALVWRSNGDPNTYLAEAIYTQCNAKGITLQQGEPKVFPLWAMDVKKNANSPHKIHFDLGLEISHFDAPILSSPNGSYIKSSEIDT